MAPLDGALALAQAHHIAVLVSQHLELDVARALDELLHVEIAVAERGRRFGLMPAEKVRAARLLVAHDAHAATTAARRSLDDDRKADLPRPLECFVGAGKNAVRTGQNGHARLFHGGAGLLFFSHQAGNFRRRADELDVAGLADFGEVGVLRQQAVAGMDGVHVGDFRGADHGRNVQIAQPELGRADADGFVGETHVQRVAVGLAVDGHGLYAQFLAGTDHAQGDLTAIGDQDFLEHFLNCRIRITSAFTHARFVPSLRERPP